MKNDTTSANAMMKDIFSAGLANVDPFGLICKGMTRDGSELRIRFDDFERRVRLDDFERIFVIGTGKATAKMAKAAESILGDRITEGAISVKYGHTEDLRRIRTIEAGHPVPDENSVRAANEIAALARKADKKTFVLTLISGGGSACLAAPAAHPQAPLSLGDKQNTTQILLECGAAIEEINCVRKHLSGIKGGKLAQMIFPAASAGLILSDVVGDRLDAIASGITVPDPTTFGDMAAIIEKYEIAGRLPESVNRILELGLAGRVEETPKQDGGVFEKSDNVLVGTNRSCLFAAERHAKALGFNTVVLSSQITGESREVAKVFCGIGKDIKKHGTLAPPPACVLAGGETTVGIRGNGLGGRNQEMALAFLAEIKKDPEGADGIFFLSAATDGNDGPTDAAGAFASREIFHRSRHLGLSISNTLKTNDAYTFFDNLGYLFKTGPTNTNVCDIQIMLVF